MPPMAGFSEDDVPLAIGYYLGLRWFTALQVSHGEFSISASPGGVVGMQCNCGEVSHAPSLPELENWYIAHSASPGTVLNGARGRWEPGVNHAVCGAGRSHRVPDRDCGCGFWSYWSLGSQQAAAPHVAALVKGSGKIIKGPKGFRSATAEILALVVPAATFLPASSYSSMSEGVTLPRLLEEAYKVPVYQTIEELLGKHQAPDGQPPLADDWFWREKQRTGRTMYAPGGVAGTAAGVYPVTGITYISGGYAAGYSAGGTGSTVSGVHTAMASGAMPCMICGTVACAHGQAICARCQLSRATGKLAEAAAGMAAAADAAAQATTGVDALRQLQARRAKWEQEAPRSIMGPPDPPMGVSSIDSAGRRNRRGTQVRWGLDYIRRKFGRP